MICQPLKNDINGVNHVYIKHYPKRIFTLVVE